jgi:hypothetical protein
VLSIGAIFMPASSSKGECAPKRPTGSNAPEKFYTSLIPVSVTIKTAGASRMHHAAFFITY